MQSKNKVFKQTKQAEVAEAAASAACLFHKVFRQISCPQTHRNQPAAVDVM